jgi:phage antirepressor YoqD-like protein
MQKKVRKAAADGMTVPKIAKQLGLPYQSLRYWMMSNGVEYKKDNRGRKAPSHS